MSIRQLAALAVMPCTLLTAACGGNNDDVGTEPQTPSFSLSVTPVTLSVQAGATPTAVAPVADRGFSAQLAAAGTGTLDVAISRAGGFNGSVAVTVQGLPTGVTASALTIGGNSVIGTITITASATAGAGTSTLTVRATGTGVTEQTRTVQLTITAAASFTLSLTPAALSIVRGQSDSATVNITRAGGFVGPVNLTSSGGPNGITVGFTPASVTGGSATIAVNVAAAVAPGAYPIVIHGTGAGVAARNATLMVTVTP